MQTSSTVSFKNKFNKEAEHIWVGSGIIFTGLCHLVYSIYHISNFYKLHVIPGFLYTIFPSPYHFYVPVAVLSSIMISGGVYYLMKSKWAIPQLNFIAVSALLFCLPPAVFEFGDNFQNHFYAINSIIGGTYINRHRIRSFTSKKIPILILEITTYSILAILVFGNVELLLFIENVISTLLKRA